MNQNPVLVQTAPARQYGYLRPLVLIHDGGGTIFGYFSLGSLHRKVWAIHNPHFSTAEPWKGGIEEMADTYIKLIERAGIRGSIILGGWSLGGYLSLSIAHKLASRPSSQITIAGLLLVDSPYHPPADQIPPSNAEPKLDDLPILVQKSFERAEEMLEAWELPKWDGPACGGRPMRFTAGGDSLSVPTGTVQHKPLDGRWELLKPGGFEPEHHTSIKHVDKGIRPPPAILLRCVVPTPSATPEEDGPLQVDMFRRDPLLGWGGGDQPNFIKAVIDTDAGHYDVFKFSHIEQVTQHMNQCLEILDSLRLK